MSPIKIQELISGGIQNANAGTYFTFDGINVVDLYINNVIIATWTGSAPVGFVGQPIGLLLGITYSA